VVVLTTLPRLFRNLRAGESGMIVVNRISPGGKVVRHVTAGNNLEFGMSSLKKACI
jgi:hypothetical protein